MQPFSKRIVVFIALAAIVAANAMNTYGQSTAFGGRVTPSHVPAAAVENPSPSNIYGPQGLNINIGIYALRYFKTGRIGIKAGLEHGALRYSVGVDAPRNAFGTGSGGDSQINVGLESNPFTYSALTISAAYKLPIKERFLEFTLGPSIRHYGFGKDGFYEIGHAFNRSTPYDWDDPLAGPPDVRASVTDLDHFYLSFPVSVDYVVRMSRLSQIKFGIMHNISTPLNGVLDVQMYGQMYHGSFRPRTGFWGVSVQYERLSKKSAASYKKRDTGPDHVGKFRKALFFETYVKSDFLSHVYDKPYFLSANYDIRLKKDSNQGFGFTGGAGLGDEYLTTVQTNNTSNHRRRLALPVGINYIVGAKQHGGEVGVGLTPQIPLNNVRTGFEFNGTVFSARLGYRFQPLREGFIGRVAWIPTAEKIPVYSNYAINWGNVGISVGYSFR